MFMFIGKGILDDECFFNIYYGDGSLIELEVI